MAKALQCDICGKCFEIRTEDRSQIRFHTHDMNGDSDPLVRTNKYDTCPDCFGHIWNTIVHLSGGRLK